MNTIINTFETWTTAQTQKTSGRGIRANNQSLLGIQKLRELIFELALQGKLVLQDQNDVPASILLKKIKLKRTKKEDSLPKIPVNDMPFGLPKNWVFCRLGDVFNATQGIQIPKTEQIDEQKAGFRKYLYISDFKDAGTPKYVKDIYPHKNIIPNDLIMINTGATAGEVLTGQDGVLSNNLFKIEYPEEIDRNFAICFFKSPFFYGVVSKTLKGGANPHMGHQRFYEWLFPFPPLPEQHRIVAKVDELMALCDQLEQQQTDSNAAHQTLVELLLGALTTATSPAELEEAWQRIATHFDTLFTTEYSIDQLKQSILQLAVMGKLVPQNSKDEPASELLKKIAKEKARLVKEGKIKKQAPLPEITDDEKPFELADGWEWVRLGTYTIVISGGTFKSEDFNGEEGTKVIKITNAGVGEFVETEDYLPSSYLQKYPQYVVEKDDLILALTRPYISTGLKISMCPNSYNNSLLNQRVAAIKFIKNVEYLFLFLQSSFVLNLYMERFGNSGLQPNLKMSDVTELVIPLPSLEEQHRIVAKVDELFAICDTLKERINQAQTTQNLLAGTVVEQALVKNPVIKVVYATREQMNLAAEPE
jgi:type I restriction enzyme, S subunit